MLKVRYRHSLHQDSKFKLPITRLALIKTLCKCLRLASNETMTRTLVFFLAFVIAETPGPFIHAFNLDTSGLGPVPLSRDPHFQMIMENARVRVWILELRPNETTSLVSRDHDFLQVPLNEGWLSASIEGKQPVPFWVEKKARFVRGGFSQIVQNGEPKTVLRLLEVEFIQSVGVEQCGPEAQVSCGCFGSGQGILVIYSCGMLETDDVSIKQLENHGADKMGLSVAPALLVAVDSVKVQPMASSADAGLILKPGEVLWVDKPVQTIESLDQNATAKGVTVEFKSPSAGLGAR